MNIRTTPPLLYRKTPDGYALHIDPKAMRGDGGDGDGNFPLSPLPCLVESAGNIVGLAQLWYDPVTGEAVCRTSGVCGCPPDAPPDPETSCCPLWYCTADGPVEVSADADGVYTPPTGWTGGPYLTEAEALEACPLPPVLVGTCCGGGKLMPARATFTLSNKTGVYASLPNSVEVNITATAASPSAVWSVTVSSSEFQVQFFCNDTTKAVYVAMYRCGANTVAAPSQTVWVANGGTNAMDFRHDFTCDEDLTATLSGTQFVGTVNAWSAGCGGTGSFDLYVTWG